MFYYVDMIIMIIVFDFIIINKISKGYIISKSINTITCILSFINSFDIFFAFLIINGKHAI